MKIATKTLALILSLIFLISNIPCAVFAASGLSSSEKAEKAVRWCQDLQELFDDLEAMGITSVYDEAEYAIVERFAQKMQTETDTERIDRYFNSLAEIYGRVKQNLISYIDNSSLPIAVNKKSYSNIKLKGGNLYSVTEEGGVTVEKPIVTGGYSGWQSSNDDVALAAAAGATSIEGPQYHQDDIVAFAAGTLTKSSYADDTIAEIKAFLDMCERLNIAVSFCFDTLYMPSGFIEYYKDRGIKDGGAKYDTYLAFNPTYPQITNLHKKHAEILLPELAEYKCITSVFIANEPRFEAYDKNYYKQQWPTYLTSLYGNIEALNTAYGATYTDFSEVEMPQTVEKTPLYYDYREFTTNILKTYFTSLKRIINTYLPDMPVGIKAMQYTRATERDSDMWNIKYEKYKDIFDVNYNDSFAFYNDSALPIQGKMLWYDYMRSVIDAPVINGENHVIKDSKDFDDNAKIPGHVATDMWQGAIHGADQTSNWLLSDNDYTNQHYPDPSALYRPELMSKLSKTTLDMERLSDEITAIQDADADTAIFYSDTTWNYTRAFTKNNYTAYLAAIYNGHKVDFITESTLDKLENQKVLIVPCSTNTTEEAVRKINQFAQSGGTVLFVGSDCLKKDKNNQNFSSEVLSLVSAAYEKAYKVDSILDVASRLEQIYIEKDMDSVVVMDEATGKRAEGVEWTSASFNGKTIVNLCNYNEEALNVSVCVNEKRAASIKNLRTEKSGGDTVRLAPYDPILAEVSVLDDEKTYEPKNVIAITNSTKAEHLGVNVSWVNPTADTLSRVAIFKRGDSGYTLLSEELSTEPGKVCGWRDTNFSTSATGHYKLSFQFADGKNIEVQTEANASSGEYQAFVSNINDKRFGVNYNTSYTDLIPGTINKVVREGKTNNYYYDFAANIVDPTEESAVVVFKLYEALNKNDDGVLTFNAKTDKAVECSIYVGTTESHNKIKTFSIAPSQNWQAQSVEFNSNQKTESFHIVFEESVERLSLDNIKVTRKSDSAVLGEQTFEHETTTYPIPLDYPKAVKKAEVSTGENSVAINIGRYDASESWYDSADKAPGGVMRTVNVYNVYEVSNGKRYLRAKVLRPILQGPVPEIKLDNLINGKKYTWEITCEDEKGVFESAPITIEGIPTEEVYISEYEFKDTNGETQELLFKNTYSMQVQITNNSDGSIPAQAVVGIYSGNVLLDVLMSQPVSVNKNETTTVQINNIDLSGYGDNVFVKCFLFEDFMHLTPLKNTKKYLIY